jgi:hypothetical protein
MTSSLALVGLGVVLLVRPPAWLMERLCASYSVARRLRGIIGVFLVAVAIEQVHRFSAFFERTIQSTLYWVPALGYALLVLMGIVIPVGLGALGVVLVLTGRHATPDQAKRDAGTGEVEHASLADLWSVVAVLTGAILLALAMPELPNILAYIGFNYQPGAEGDRTWIAFSTWTTLLPFSLQVGMAAYLLAGAPRLVRWHLTKLSSQTES